MGVNFPPQYQHLDGLLFVSRRPEMSNIDAAVIADLNAIVGDDRLVYLPQSATNVHQAAAHVRQRLQDTLRIERTIKGVVLLGDYATVPSWKMVSTSVQWPNDAPPAAGPGIR